MVDDKLVQLTDAEEAKRFKKKHGQMMQLIEELFIEIIIG